MLSVGFANMNDTANRIVGTGMTLENYRCLQPCLESVGIPTLSNYGDYDVVVCYTVASKVVEALAAIGKCAVVGKVDGVTQILSVCELVSWL